MLKIVAALDVPTANSTNGQILPPCRACKTLVGSFTKGMERTARGKFEGGDANWEETRLRNYAFSEVRLVEIQEKLCSEVSVGKNQVRYTTNKTILFKSHLNILIFSVIVYLKHMKH